MASDDEFALVVGICLGVLLKDRRANDDMIRTILRLRSVQGIARAAPGRMLAEIYRLVGEEIPQAELAENMEESNDTQ